jgi:SAM-dependent methyltransferase
MVEVDRIYSNYTSTTALAGNDAEGLVEYSLAAYKEQIIPHLPAERQIKILDIGCGYGRLMEALRRNGYQNVRGLDISQEQIETAFKMFGFKDLIHGDAVAWLDGNDELFDVIFCLDVLEHLEISTAIDLLSKMRERLAENGKILLQVPNGMAPFAPTYHGDVTHVRAFSVPSLKQLVRMAGFRQIETYSAFPPKFKFHLIRRLFWTMILDPVLRLLYFVAYSRPRDCVFTQNIIAVARNAPAPATNSV